MHVFATVGHGAAVIGLAVETLPPSLLHPIVLHVWVRPLLVNPARTPACSDLADNSHRPAGSARAAVASGTPVWRGSFASAELGQDGRGPKPRARPPPFPFARSAQAENGRGPVVPTGRPSSNRKNTFSVSLLLFEKGNTLENVCVLILAPNLLKQILLGSLSPDLHDKNIACQF